VFGLNHVFELVNSVDGTNLTAVEVLLALGNAGSSKTPLSLSAEDLSCAQYVRYRFFNTLLTGDADLRF